MKNLKQASEIIKRAIKDNGEIVLFSDSDLDGTASMIIMEESIKSLGGSVSCIYFPDRDKEGYGLNERSLKSFKKHAPGLLILLDCGISNYIEVEKAKEMGFEVIIVEHHEIIDRMPEAVVINPKQQGDDYAFKYLATCGLCFRLAEEMLDMSETLEKSFLELVAIATIADKMPQEQDNEWFINKGLEYLPSTFRPGLKVFFKEFDSFKEIVRKMVGLLHITKIKDHLTRSYTLLSCSDEAKAEKLLHELIKASKERMEIINTVYEEISDRFFDDNSPYIIYGDKDIPLYLAGALATRVQNKFKKPVFIYGIRKDIVRGSVRSPQDFDTVKALNHCSSLLDTFGGHPPASGFSLKKKNLDKFKSCLQEYFI